MNREKNKKMSFKKFLKVYVAILIAITIGASIYVYGTLKKYELNQVNNYMENVISQLKKYADKDEIGKYIDNVNITKSEFETEGAQVEKGLNELFRTCNDIDYEVNANSKDEIKPVYDIFVNGNKILEVGLDGSNMETRLSLLTFSNWKTSYINVEAENGLFKCDISVPSNYDVYVNEKKLSEEQIVTSNFDSGLVEISKYVEIPYSIKYEVNGFVEKPNIKILDKNGNEVKESDVIVNDTTKEIATLDDAEKEIKEIPNILKISEDWSLFLSDDLDGSSNGFYNISKYLIKDSYLYNYAYKWATNIDITFISNHTLKNPAFTNEKVSNFIIYNNNAFSCEIYLDKNMRIANGNDLVDKMNERMYFAYYDDTDDGIDNASWKLVNMQSITNNN